MTRPDPSVAVGLDDENLDAMRRELTRRVKNHPPSSWSGQLLAVVVNAIDLQFGDGGEKVASAQLVKLSVIREAKSGRVVSR
jgi:hypothetical protein